MIKYLKDIKSIDISRVLLLKAKELKISDLECRILLLLIAFEDMRMPSITPVLLAKYCTMTNKQLDNALGSLLKKKLISNHNGTIRLNNIIDRLLVETKENEEVADFSLLDVFEESFARTLTPMELEILKEWKNTGYDDDMIIKALKEAVKSSVLNFRYIEGILQNWSKNGIKQRYIEDAPKPRNVEVSEYKWWEDE